MKSKKSQLLVVKNLIALVQSTSQAIINKLMKAVAVVQLKLKEFDKIKSQ